MGKKSREKRERKELSVTESTNRNDGAEESSLSSSQRRKLLIGAGMGLAAAAGGRWYTIVQKDKEDSVSVNGYISVNDAVKLYGELEKQVKAKWAQAQRERKPLRLVVMEDHDSTDALAHEMMLVDIAGRLGMRSLLTEIGSNTKEGLLNADINKYPLQIANKQKLLRQAVKNNFTIENIDTLYLTEAMNNEAFHTLSKSIADEMLRQRFPGSGATLTITPSENPNDRTFKSSISGKLNMQEAQEAGKIITAARLKADAQQADEREQTMIENLQRFGGGVVTMGVKHGAGILTALRNTGDVDLAIYASEPALEKAYMSGLLMSDDVERRLRWANDPANAIR